MGKLPLNLPNFMGCLRFLAGISLLVIAWHGHKNIFIGVLIMAFLLDAIDGPIARYYHETSVQGARLDSLADFTVYCSLLISVWYLWPEIFVREQVYIGMAALSILLPAMIGVIKFKTFTSYHTWLVKLASVCIAPASILLILEGPAWPFRFASIVSMLAGLEEIMITMALNKPGSDVRHIIAVIKSRNTQQDSKLSG